MRDGWQIGANTLDERIVARMRSVITKEVPGTADIRGDGLGCVVRVGDEQQVATDPADPNRCMPIQSRAHSIAPVMRSFVALPLFWSSLFAQ